MIHLHFNHYVVVFEELFDVHKPFEPLKYAYKTQSLPIHIHTHYLKIDHYIFPRVKKKIKFLYFGCGFNLYITLGYLSYSAKNYSYMNSLFKKHIKV